MSYTQQNAMIAVHSPLGEDALLLRGYVGAESISRPFRFELELLAERPVVPTKILGQKVSVTTALSDDSKRYFSGYVSRFTYVGTDSTFTHYRAEVVPWLWFLTRKTNCRIFQNKTATEIISTIFGDLGFADFKDRTSGSLEAMDYCVQYRETDFNFVSRLMERFGIFYFFEHAKDAHTMVLANDPSVHKPCPGAAKIRYEGMMSGVQDEDTILSVDVEHELRPGKCALTDYNFETPNTSLLVDLDTNVSVAGNTKLEIFDYPGDYLAKSAGEGVVKVRMEEEELPYVLISGSSTARSFAPGFRFELVEHPNSAVNGSYILTEVQHVASAGDAYSGSQGSAVHESYSNHFRSIPAATRFRPLRLTPKPTVQGPQTAMVVGPSGEEIYCDKYGRVKVQFHWDREGQRNESSSCWMRVSQPWGGKGWGGMWIPRIGQEVIVEFLEGDPDRPIITGRVYNAEQMPPYTLPDNSTRSCMKSRSSKGGGPNNYNEIRFEDKKGSEQLFLHAEFDKDERIKNDSREYVGKDRHLVVKGSQKESVERDKHARVRGNHTESIDGGMSLQVGSSCAEKVGMNYAVESGQQIHLKAGMNVVLEAGVELTIKAAGGFINIGPAGVAISGTMVLINSGGAAGSGSGANTQSPDNPDVADDGTKGTKVA